MVSRFFLALWLVTLAIWKSQAAISPSNSDLWDVTNGITITATSQIRPDYYPSDMFGTSFSQEAGHLIFDDLQTNGFVHFIEWRTPNPVRLSSFNLFAGGDGPLYNNQREFEQFVLKGKLNEADPFVTIYTFTPTHPYTFLDPTTAAIISAAIAPIDAKYFRAEFVQREGGLGFDGPRIVELDGFGTVILPSIPQSHTDLFDVSQGASVLATSGVRFGFLADSMFGSDTASEENGSTIFSDGHTNGFRHFTEWKTAQPVDLTSIALFAAGDGDQYNNEREFQEFVLRAKLRETDAYSTIYTFTPQHPYQLLDPITAALLVTAVPFTEAQFFRAEFVQWNAGRGYDGPRIAELDGFGSFAPMTLNDGILDSWRIQHFSDVTTPNAAAIADPDNDGADNFQEYLDGTDPLTPNDQSAPLLSISPVSGTFATPLIVQIFGRGQTTIRYTTDGSQPTSTSPVFSQPINLSTSTTVRAVLFVNNVPVSLPVSQSYTVNTNPAPSHDDVFDVHQGAKILRTSDVRNGFLADAIIGNDAPSVETGSTIFKDGHAEGFTHFIEFQTARPVRLDRVDLYAAGDPAQYLFEREFASFVLRAKSSPNRSDFDLVVASYTPASHPYNQTGIQPVFSTGGVSLPQVDAQFFRAEFVQWNAGRGFDAPRIVELEGFGTFTQPTNPTVADWTFEEGVAGNPVGSASDSSGNGHDLAVTAGARPQFVPTQLPALGAVSISFPAVQGGIGGALRSGDSVDFNLGAAFTLEASINPGQANNDFNRGILVGQDAASGRLVFGLDYRSESRQVDFLIGDSSGQIDAAAAILPNDNQSHHIAGVYSNQTLLIYLDKTLVGSVASSLSVGIPPGGAARVTLGANDIGGYWFDGTLDRVRISSQILTPADFFATGSKTNPLRLVIPLADQTVTVGSNLVLKVTADGPAPLTYLWRFNGVIIPQATSDTLLVSQIQSGQAGDYSVTVSATGTSLTSTAHVSVQPAAPAALHLVTPLNDQTVIAGSDITLKVGAEGPGPLIYSWRFNGILLASAVTDTFILRNIQPNEGGDYTVTVTAGGNVVTSNAHLIVQPVVTPPTTGVVADWTFEEGVPDLVAASATDHSGNGHTASLVAGAEAHFAATTSADGNVSVRFPAADGPSRSVLRAEDTSAFNLNGDFTLEASANPGSANTNSSRGILVGQDADSERMAFGLFYQSETRTVQFLITAADGQSNSVAALLPDDARSHHVAGVFHNHQLAIYLDGLLIATGNTPLTVGIAQDRPGRVTMGGNDSGALWFDGTLDRVRISNTALAPADFFPRAAAPVVTIVTALTNQTVLTGADVTLKVVAQGNAPLGYAWRFNGGLILGASSDALILSNAQPDQSGNYSVTVANAGTVVTSTATVTVVDGRPKITVQPQSQIVSLGLPVRFNVEVVSGEPVDYQWLFGNLSLPNSDSATLTIFDVQPGNAGEYRVLVSNKYGVTFSDPASLSFSSADSEAPLISISAPNYSSTLDSRVTIEGTASDNIGVALLRFERDGVQVGPVTLSDGHFSIPNLLLANGTNNFRVIAIDAVGNQSSASVTVVLQASRTFSVPEIPPTQEGALVTIPILLTSRGDVGAATVALNYPVDYLGTPEIAWPDFLAGWTQLNTNRAGEIRLSFALPGVAVPAGTQQIATVTLRARSIPQALDCSLALDLLGIYSMTGDPFAAGTDLSSGTVHLTPRKYVGDNNANDRLDVGDASVIMRLVAGIDPLRSWDVTGNDLNSNNAVDAGDAIRVLRAAVNLDPQPRAAALSALALPVASSATIRLTTDGPQLAPGQKLVMQLLLDNVKGAVAGAAFKLQFPTNALHLENALAHRAGVLVPTSALAFWNISPAQNDYARQDGVVYAAFSSPSLWPASNGELALFTFTVLDGALGQAQWQVRISGAELSDGVAVNALNSAEFTLTGRPPILATLGETRFNAATGEFSLKLQAESGSSYVVQTSEDLVSWTDLGTYSDVSGDITVTDQQPNPKKARFYRAVQAP